MWNVREAKEAEDAYYDQTSDQQIVSQDAVRQDNTTHPSAITPHFRSMAVTLAGTLDAALICLVTQVVVTWLVPVHSSFLLTTNFISCRLSWSSKSQRSPVRKGPFRTQNAYKHSGFDSNVAVLHGTCRESVLCVCVKFEKTVGNSFHQKGPKIEKVNVCFGPLLSIQLRFLNKLHFHT